MKDAPVPEGEEPKSAVEIVEQVLKTEVKQSTFLRNVGLQSSRNNSGKATTEVAAHVRDLEQKLERSGLTSRKQGFGPGRVSPLVPVQSRTGTSVGIGPGS